LDLSGVSRRIIFRYAGDAKDFETGEAKESFEGFGLLKRPRGSPYRWQRERAETNTWRAGWC
jgi:hypothetical protein